MNTYKLLLSCLLICSILHSCNKGNTSPDGTIETGNGKLKQFKGFEFSYDNKSRLIKLEPNPALNYSATTITKFFYKDATQEFYRVELSSINNPDAKTPVVLQYNSRNNLEKIIYKHTIYPPSPNYNNITHLSTYNSVSEPLPVFIDSIIYNSQNNPIEIFRIQSTVLQKIRISYYPGDTLIKTILFPSATVQKIECINYEFKSYNPLHFVHKNLYLLDNAVFGTNLPGTILPVNMLWAPAFSSKCDNYLGLSKYIPINILAYGEGYNGPTYYNLFFRTIIDDKGNITEIKNTNSTSEISTFIY